MRTVRSMKFEMFMQLVSLRSQLMRRVVRSSDVGSAFNGWLWRITHVRQRRSVFAEIASRVHTWFHLLYPIHPRLMV